jgi:hypothetical protein
VTARPADIDIAIRRYQAAPVSLSGESVEKVDAIRQLEPYLADPEAESFLVSVLRDSDEYDLARVEICKTLQASSAASHGDRYAHALVALLESEPDLLVKQWAAIALRAFRHHPGVVLALVSKLAEVGEDLDVRHNALASLSGAVIGPAEHAVLEPLLADPDLGQAVTHLLRGVAR